jgi:ribosome hibernation promoting factor
MKIQVRARSVELTPTIRAHVDSRLNLALGRFGERVDKVIVRFSPGDAHNGKPEIRCRIEVALRPRPVTVEDADADLFAAVDRASERLFRSLARALEREQTESRIGAPISKAIKP